MLLQTCTAAEVGWQGCSARSPSIASCNLPCTVGCLGTLGLGKRCGSCFIRKMQSKINLYCTELLPPMTAVYPLQCSFCHFSRRGHLNLWGILTFFYFSQPQESSPTAAYPPDFFSLRATFFGPSCSLCIAPPRICLMAFHWETGTDTYFLPAASCSISALWQVAVPTQLQLGS